MKDKAYSDNRENLLEKALVNQLRAGLEKRVYSGVVAGIINGSSIYRKNIFVSAGYTSLYDGKKAVDKQTFFDLASLTKPLATTLAVLCLIKQKKLSLDSRLDQLSRGYLPEDKRKINLKMLLNHSSGLPAHREFFRTVKGVDRLKAKETMLRLVLDEPLEYEPGVKTVYSDLGYMLLGWLVEEISTTPLNRFVEKNIYKPLGLEEHLAFLPLDDKVCRQGRSFSDTENCDWREKQLHGEVSDDNCWALGGVAGHAGLFGDIVGVTELVRHLLDQWQGREDVDSYDRVDLVHFLTRQQEEENGTWGLGFDTPSAKGSSAGQNISPTSAGHLGFTGTSFWIDPVRDAAVVLLTNRVHPSRDNDRIKEFRPAFHDAVFKTLDKIARR